MKLIKSNYTLPMGTRARYVMHKTERVLIHGKVIKKVALLLNENSGRENSIMVQTGL